MKGWVEGGKEYTLWDTSLLAREVIWLANFAVDWGISMVIVFPVLVK